MTTVADILRVARGEVGTHESPAGSNDVKYAAWYGLNGNPWCAMFVSWVFHQAGYNLVVDTSKGFSYCPSAVDWFKRHGMFHATGPFQPGDIIFYDWASNGISDHVGIVVNDNGSVIHTLEGNTSLSNQQNGGAVMARERYHGSTVVGVGRVKLDSHPPSEFSTNDGYHHPELKKGDTNENDGFTTKEVSHLQSLLHKNRINIGIDGAFGVKTDAAVRKFQNYHDIKADGVVGSVTWRWLHK